MELFSQSAYMLESSGSSKQPGTDCRLKDFRIIIEDHIPALSSIALSAGHLVQFVFRGPYFIKYLENLSGVSRKWDLSRML